MGSTFLEVAQLLEFGELITTNVCLVLQGLIVREVNIIFPFSLTYFQVIESGRNQDTGTWVKTRGLFIDVPHRVDVLEEDTAFVLTLMAVVFVDLAQAITIMKVKYVT